MTRTKDNFTRRRQMDRLLRKVDAQAQRIAARRRRILAAYRRTFVRNASAA